MAHINPTKDIEIVRNLGDFRTYWTVEVKTKFTKKQAEKFYSYVENYPFQLTSGGNGKQE